MRERERERGRAMERVRENKDASHLRLSCVSFPQWDRGSFLLPEGGWMWHRGRAVPWQRSSSAGDRCSSWAQPPWHLGLQLLTAHFLIAQHSLVRDGPLLFKKEKWNGGRLNKLQGHSLSLRLGSHKDRSTLQRILVRNVQRRVSTIVSLCFMRPLRPI